MVYQWYDKITRESIVKREKKSKQDKRIWSNGHLSKELTFTEEKWSTYFLMKKMRLFSYCPKRFPKNPEFIDRMSKILKIH